jgi:hypothetical protein
MNTQQNVFSIATTNSCKKHFSWYLAIAIPKCSLVNATAQKKPQKPKRQLKAA